MEPLALETLGLPQPGAVLLGKYRVERIIGVGGMGAVVSARHLQLDERVAIKLLLPQMLQNEEVVQRFLREARAAIKIRSEHCVRVLDVGALDNGAPYMVMEFLQGEDLAALVTRVRPLPIADTIDYVLQAGEALAEAHVLGIVHRDLKPANLFLTRRADGTASVKVLDFGISKQAASGAEAGVTKTQAVLGSPRYMSPEQMRSTRDVDARADVWALGAVVYELVAGEPPFDAETMTALCAAILQDPPRPIHVARPDVPHALAGAILHALEKDRNRRFQNVAELAAALAPFGSHVARASAERIARVIGVPMSAPFDARGPSTAIVGGPSPMAATTGASSSITSDVVRPSRGGMVAVAAMGVLVLAAVAALAVVVVVRRPAAPRPAPAVATPLIQAPAASIPAPTTLPLEPASPPASAASSAASPAPSSSSPAAAPPPAIVPARPGPPTPGKPPLGPIKNVPSNSNPFGDDRHG